MAEDASSGSNLSALVKWAGGIVSAVLIGVLTFWLTRTPTPPPAPIVIPPVALNGVVANAESHVLIGSATVSVTLGPNTAEQATDELGRYSVVLAPGGDSANMGSVKIAAPGYVQYSNTVALVPGDNFAEIAIDPVPQAAVAADTVAHPAAGGAEKMVMHHAVTGAPQAAVVAPQPKAMIVLKAPPADYVKRAATAYAGVKKP